MLVDRLRVARGRAGRRPLVIGCVGHSDQIRAPKSRALICCTTKEREQWPGLEPLRPCGRHGPNEFGTDEQGGCSAKRRGVVVKPRSDNADVSERRSHGVHLEVGAQRQAHDVVSLATDVPPDDNNLRVQDVDKRPEYPSDLLRSGTERRPCIRVRLRSCLQHHLGEVVARGIACSSLGPGCLHNGSPARERLEASFAAAPFARGVFFLRMPLVVDDRVSDLAGFSFAGVERAVEKQASSRPLRQEVRSARSSGSLSRSSMCFRRTAILLR